MSDQSKQPPEPQEPADGSGSGADSALRAMIRKRPPRPGHSETPPQQTQRPTPADKSP